MWLTRLDVHYPPYGRLEVIVPGVWPDFSGQWLPWWDVEGKCLAEDWSGQGLTVICAWEEWYGGEDGQQEATGDMGRPDCAAGNSGDPLLRGKVLPRARQADTNGDVDAAGPEPDTNGDGDDGPQPDVDLDSHGASDVDLNAGADEYAPADRYGQAN